MSPLRKYDFKKGEFIGNSFLKYVCEAGYKGKHRYIMAYCDLCGSIKRQRLENIINGKVKSCGCYHNKMIEEGILTKLSIKTIKDKPYLQKGGRGWVKGYCIQITEQQLKELDINKILPLILDFLKGVK